MSSTVKILIFYHIIKNLGNAPAVQWLGLRAFTSEGLGLIIGWGTKIPEASWLGPQQKTLDFPLEKII